MNLPLSFDAFEFRNSADLLQAFLGEKKRKNPRFSVRAWAKRFNLSTSGMIVNIAKGRRLPTLTMAKRLARAMELSPLSEEYFLALVARDRLRDEDEKEFYQANKRLKALQLKRNAKTVEGETLEVFSRFKHVAVKEAMGMKGAEPSANWVHRQLALGLSEEDAERILKVLVEHGLLRLLSNGDYASAKETTETPIATSTESTRQFHRESLQHAIAALDGVPVNARCFNSQTMPVRSAQYAEARAAIDDFIAEFAARFGASENTGDEVYQLNLNYVPLTVRSKDRP